jgi:hypothetical protein
MNLMKRALRREARLYARETIGRVRGLKRAALALQRGEMLDETIKDDILKVRSLWYMNGDDYDKGFLYGLLEADYAVSLINGRIRSREEREQWPA